MSGRILFELPLVLWAGLGVAALLLAGRAWQLSARGLPGRRVTALVALRALALAALVLLLARPMRPLGVQAGARPTVAVLLDRSRSMDLREPSQARYARAGLLAQHLSAALFARGFQPRLMGFAETAAPLAPVDVERTAADGRATDLGGAIAQAVTIAQPPPVAVVALTDGVANRSEANASAVQGLIDAQTAFVGIGFGRDEGVPTLAVERLSGPPRVAPRQRFRLQAHLQALGGSLPAFDLLLLRDGRLVQTRRVPADAVTRSRLWSEGFELTEAEEGVHQYVVQLRPTDRRAVVVSAAASTPVRVGQEKEFRILFVQGALTWDFKFIGRALRADPTVKLTGLSRTSQQSVFRQNVESAEELSGGFPTDLAALARYRVIVLSELRPADLTPAQQELAARFCAELGGGVLLLGGESTFDGSWQGSRLEQLLPVTFDPAGGVRGLDRPFHLRLTADAQRHGVFQVADDGSSARVWDALPTFTRYGRVLREKPGAVVWARHDQDSGPHGRRVLMAAQPYGAGLSAIICVQNLWRWRLARDSDPQTFDRFWRQLFRHLGQAGRQDVQIQLADQELRAHADVRAVVERQPRPEGDGDAPVEATVRGRAPDGQQVLEQRIRLVPRHPVEVRFRAGGEGLYTISVEDAAGIGLGTQTFEIRAVDHEMERTGRDMENLRQWASLSQGMALGEEEVGSPDGLAARIRERLETGGRRGRRAPVGVNATVMAGILAALCAEWTLRRRWGLR